MLSLDDVQNVSFRRAKFGGYRPEDVDAFIDDVQISYEKLLQERSSMISKIEQMKSCIDKYQASDGAIKDVIADAQRVAEKSLEEAETQTQNMIDEATESSKKMIEEAKKEVEAQNEIASRIKSESTRLREKLAEIYETHMKLINEIPEFVEEKVDETAEFELESEEPKLTPEEKVDRIINGATVDIFSEPYSDDEFAENVKSKANDKFKNLEFGENYVYDESEKSSGVYNGIFEK